MSHQGVILTPWWSRQLTWGGDGKKEPPRSQYDSWEILVVDRGAEMVRTMHQQVILTRWWSRRSMKGREDKNEPPTSHTDSLVV